MKPSLKIIYCPQCGWMLRATYMAQEFLTTFGEDLKSVTLEPAIENGQYTIYVDDKKIFDRKESGGFPEIKVLKQLIRDQVHPGKSLGHSDRKSEGLG